MGYPQMDLDGLEWKIFTKIGDFGVTRILGNVHIHF